jgi:tRNA/rRNA methyltransferase
MLETALDAIRIVLVEPAGSLNVGAIARVMKNMGLQQLVLVNPQCDPLGPEARQMAVHAVDVLEAARIVASLPDALQGCQRAIATTGRSRSPETILEHPRMALPWLLESVQAEQAALMFGPEDRGLNTTELNYAQRFVYIPTNPVYPSMNLAQAVGICCYELSQLVQGQAPLPVSAPPPLAAAPAPLEQLEAYYHHLETLLLRIRYLHPHTASSRMKKFRRLLSRALPSSEEVALLRGIVGQMEWTIQHPSTPDSDSSDSPEP